jgi:hypothetical protein
MSANTDFKFYTKQQELRPLELNGTKQHKACPKQSCVHLSKMFLPAPLAEIEKSAVNINLSQFLDIRQEVPLQKDIGNCNNITPHRFIQETTVRTPKSALLH